MMSPNREGVRGQLFLEPQYTHHGNRGSVSFYLFVSGMLKTERKYLFLEERTRSQIIYVIHFFWLPRAQRPDGRITKRRLTVKTSSVCVCVCVFLSPHSMFGYHWRRIGRWLRSINCPVAQSRNLTKCSIAVLLVTSFFLFFCLMAYQIFRLFNTKAILNDTIYFSTIEK